MFVNAQAVPIEQAAPHSTWTRRRALPTQSLWSGDRVLPGDKDERMMTIGPVSTGYQIATTPVAT